MQKFTRFYGKVAYLGMISDFSTSLRFLFYELISGFQILISVISPRAYEISPSVGPLGETRRKEIIEIITGTSSRGEQNSICEQCSCIIARLSHFLQVAEF